jgi:hypothetical protein
LALSLPAPGPHDIAVEHPAKVAPVLRVWSDGKLVRGPEEVPALAPTDAKLDLGGDFTALGALEGRGGGTLFSMRAPEGKWSPDAKALLIRGGWLVYDIGWLGAMTGGPVVNDVQPHVAVLSVSGGTARLWLDGKVIAGKGNFTTPQREGHVFKVGRAAPDFGGEFTQGKIGAVQVWRRALPERAITRLFKDDGVGANPPDFTHLPVGGARPVIESGTGWLQALERSDHAEIVGGWNDLSLAQGARIYQSLCVHCHGTREQPGGFHGNTLPRASDFLVLVWVPKGSTPTTTCPASSPAALSNTPGTLPSTRSATKRWPTPSPTSCNTSA